MSIEISQEYLWAKDFIERIPQDFPKDGLILEEGRNTIKKFEIKGQPIVVKRFKRPCLFQRFIYSFFRPTKARRAYGFAQKYRNAGIATPKEIAYIEEYSNGLFADGYFASGFSDRICVRAQLSDINFSKSLAKALAECIVRMHEHHILHGDLNTSNILYDIDAQGEMHFEFIDINRSKFPHRLSRQKCLDNLKRLTYQRDVLIYIVKMYANHRQWDETYCINFVLKRLDKFEKNNEIRTELKKIFKLKRK